MATLSAQLNFSRAENLTCQVIVPVGHCQYIKTFRVRNSIIHLLDKFLFLLYITLYYITVSSYFIHRSDINTLVNG